MYKIDRPNNEGHDGQDQQAADPSFQDLITQIVLDHRIQILSVSGLWRCRLLHLIYLLINNRKPLPYRNDTYAIITSFSILHHHAQIKLAAAVEIHLTADLADGFHLPVAQHQQGFILFQGVRVDGCLHPGETHP